jgi:hypothetical protein
MFSADKRSRSAKTAASWHCRIASGADERVRLRIGRSAVRPRPGYRIWDPTHHALGDWRAGYVSGEVGTPRAGWVHRWARRWSMRRTMTATASIVAGVMRGMAAHVSSQNAPDLLIPGATRRSSQLCRPRSRQCHHSDLGNGGDNIRDTTLCPRRESSGRCQPASRHARTRGVLDGHCGHAADAVHTVPEHHASQHADHTSRER